MANGDLSENLTKIASFNLLSVFLIVVVLVFYGVAKDIILFNMFKIGQIFVSTGISGNWILDVIVSTSNVLDIFPQLLDAFWILFAVSLAIELVIASYQSAREGWVSTLGFLTIGILFFLFMTGILSQIGDWLLIEFIQNIFSGLTYSTPFINYYLNNVFVINTVLMVLCIIANFVDFDFSGFRNRKQKENLEVIG